MNDKSIELIKPILGATMIILPIDEKIMENCNFNKNCVDDSNKSIVAERISYDEFVKIYSSLQVGDKDVFIKEEFLSINGEIYTKDTISEIIDIKISRDRLRWLESSEMTKEQSRYTIDEVLNVRVVRVQDITWKEITQIMRAVCTCSEDEEVCSFGHDGHFRNWINNYFNDINTYKKTPCVLLLEITPIKEKDK